jgi:hypothetical protein
VCDENDVNPITGSVKPKEFEVDNDNKLWSVLCGLREEIQWLTRKSYEFKREDMVEAIIIATEVAVVMRVSLAELLEHVIAQYRCAEEDDIHEYAKVPERDVIGVEVGIAAWKAARIGMSEQEITDRVRKSVQSAREYEAREANHHDGE